jgi:hypothetical protein
LAAQLERAAATGTDVVAVLVQLIANNALPEDHPARSLAHRVADIVPDLRSPARMQPPEAVPADRPMTTLSRPRRASLRTPTAPARGAETREFPACSRPTTLPEEISRPKVALTAPKFHLFK